MAYMESPTDSTNHRILLKKASDSLSKRDVTTLKFLCSDVIPFSKLETVKDGVGIWVHLEDQSLIRAGSYDFILELLYLVDRLDIIRRVFGREPQKVKQLTQMGQTSLTDFRASLCKLGKEIPQRQLESIKYMFMDELSNSEREAATDIWTLFSLLERRDLLGPSNLECLATIINVVDRPDLFDIINSLKDDSKFKDSLGLKDEYEASVAYGYQGKPSEGQNDECVYYDESELNLRSHPFASDEFTNADNQAVLNDNMSPSSGSQRISQPIQASDVIGPTAVVINNYPSIHPPAASSTGVIVENIQGSAAVNAPQRSTPGRPSSMPGRPSSVPYTQIAPCDYSDVPEPRLYQRHALSQAEYPNGGHLHSDVGAPAPRDCVDKLVTPSDIRVISDPPPGNLYVRAVPPPDGNLYVRAVPPPEPEAPEEPETLPSLLELPSYKMDSKPRGFCIVINNHIFDPVPGDKKSKKLENRPGSTVDADNLKYLFTRLGFDVLVYNNCGAQKLNDVMGRLSQNEELAKHNSIVICILSHGKNGFVYDAQGYEVSIGDILKYFKPGSCPGLMGKPKMFFIQACQGKRKQKAASKLHIDDGDHQSLSDEMPTDADFFIGYATVPGYVSYRHEDEGSWFVSTLVNRLGKYAKKYDLLSIMTEVSRGVSHQTAPGDDETYKQMPLPYSTLRKRIYLQPIHQ